MPEEVRGKRNVQRQGEWFIKPVHPNDLPQVSFDTLGCQILALPREDNNSNIHQIEASNIRVNLKTGQIYAYHGILEHDEHERIGCDNWVTFYRNTAVRSVSVKGVD